MIDAFAIIFLSVFLFVAGAVGGSIFGANMAEKRIQQEIINHGYAEFNPTNGVWQWKGK